MSYTMLDNHFIKEIKYAPTSLEGAALSFIRNSCEGLRFDKDKATSLDDPNPDSTGTSLKPNQIPFNMEKDIDRLCLENALDRFLKSGKKEDAFDVYFCYLEMFIGDYEKTRRMIELLSEYEANGSALLMKHRDHYSHSVYVFALGLAIYETNHIYRDEYKKYYHINNDKEAACHYLQFWGLTSLFHDIGYPFELPFEQVCSYFEVQGRKRSERPYVAYHEMDSFIEISAKVAKELEEIFPKRSFKSTNEVFAYILTEKMGIEYSFSEEKMRKVLNDKPTKPNEFNHFMDHAYFSATVLFKKLFDEMDVKIQRDHLDALTAILMHNSLYKFSIAHYKDKGNKPFKASLHPLAYMLMLCDELQCWDRTAYGRNSKKELHPMDCTFDFSDDKIKAVYLFDKNEAGKINYFKDTYIEWIKKRAENSRLKAKIDEIKAEQIERERNACDDNFESEGEREKTKDIGDAPKLKAFSEMYLKKDGVSKFQSDIERIVDLGDKLSVDIDIAEPVNSGSRSYLSESSYINLYKFAIVLNGRWENDKWKEAKKAGLEEQFLMSDDVVKNNIDSFKTLSLEYKLSNIGQAKAFAGYLKKINCFYTDRPVGYEMVEHFTEKELQIMGPMEHKRWLQEHYDMGWTYGDKATLGNDNSERKNNRELHRSHWDMIPDVSEYIAVSDEAAKKNYDRLDKAEQDKDTDPMDCMLAMLKAFDGIRIYRM